MACAIASGADSTLCAPIPTARSQEMPRSWSRTAVIGIPDRSDSDTRRPIASESAIAAPPALPSVQKTSKGWPLSSSFTVTYRSPSGQSILIVRPFSTDGRWRLWRRVETSRSCSPSVFLISSSSPSRRCAFSRASASSPVSASISAAPAASSWPVFPVESTCMGREPSR